MKVIHCTALGPPENLVLETVAGPEPAGDEIIIAVKATALNFFDTLIIEGKYQYRPELPFSPGAEVAGVVHKLGKYVTGFEIGDAVMAYTGWGGARQQVAVRAARAVPVPAGVSFEAAAGLTVTYGTSLHALKDRAGIRPGETLAVLGAAGGVGQAAVEIGKQLGARVIACASSDEKLAFCKNMGADDLVNYSTHNLRDELKRLTGGAGVDVLYDPVGGDLADPALRAMNWCGRYLVVGFAAGKIPKIALNLVLLKGCQVVGVFWGEHITREPEKHQAGMATLASWVAKGAITPKIYKTYRLEDTAAALADLAARKVLGKAIIVHD